MPDETFEAFMSGRQKAPKTAEPKTAAVEEGSFSSFMEGRQSPARTSRNTPTNQSKLDENLFQYDFVNYARGKGLNDNPDAPENRATDYRKAWRENSLPGLSRQPGAQTSSPRQQQQPDNRSLVAVRHGSESSTTPPRPVTQQKRNQTTPASIRQNGPTATSQQTDPFGRPTLGAQLETDLADPNAGKVSPRVEAADRFREGLPPVFFPRLASAGGRFRRAAAESIPRAVEGTAELFETLGTIGGDPVASQPTGVARAVKTVTRPTIEQIERQNPVDPNDQSFLTNKLPSALGSAAGMMGTGALGRVARIPAALSAAGIGAGVEASQVAEEADAAGISPEKRNAAIAMAGATGLTEALGIGRALDKFGLKQAFTRRAFQVLEEGGQEALQSYLENINAALVGQYDPNRPASQGVLESAVLGGLVGGTVQGVSGLAARGQRQGPVAQRPAQTAGLPDAILNRAIQNKRGAIPPTPQIATPREPLRRAGFDAMSPGQRRRALQSGIGVEQGPLPTTPGELAQRPRRGGPQIPPATEPVQPQADPTQQVIQDYVAQVEQINQIADPAQKAEALNQARAEYRAKRVQVQQGQGGKIQNNIVPSDTATLPEANLPRPERLTPTGNGLGSQQSQAQSVRPSTPMLGQDAFDSDLAFLMEDQGTPEERAPMVERLAASPFFPDAVSQFNELPTKQRAEILRQIPADLRQAIKQFKQTNKQPTPENAQPRTEIKQPTPVEKPRENVENVIPRETARAESVPRDVPQSAVEAPQKVKVGADVEVFRTDESPEYDPTTQKALVFKGRDGRSYTAVVPKKMSRTDAAVFARAKTPEGRRSAQAQESVKAPVVEDQAIPPAQSPKVATIPKLPEAPQPPPVAASGQKKVAQFGNFSTERRPVPIATAENLESLRNRRAQLVEIQARRGADLNPDLQDEIRELGSSIKTFENQQLRGQPPMEAEEIGGTASGEQNAQYQPTPGDLRKVERMRSGPAKDLDPFIKALEANRNNDITGRREMGPEEKARNRYLLDRANAIRKERRKAEGLGPKNAPRETAMEPLSKVEGADLITKTLEEQRAVIEQRKADYAVKKAKTVTHPDEAINGQPIIARTQDGRVIVPNEANKSGVSVVKDRAEAVEIPETPQRAEVPQPKVGDTVTVRFEGRDIRGELRGFDQKGRAKIRELGTGDDYTVPANRLNPAAKPQFVADAEVRLKDYASGKRAGSGGGQLADQAIVTGYNVYRAGMKFGEWSRRVIRELGNKVRPHLKAAWNQINERVSVGELPRTRADIENSPRFKKWFGESKIVDERGKPKIVYHSTQGDFDVFRDTSDIGFHFGTQKAANDRAETPTYFKNYGSQPFRDKSSVIPVYLSIKNPLKVGDVFSTSTDTLEKLIALGHIDGNDPNFANIKTALRKGEIDSKEALRLRRTAMVTALEEQGYDGLEYTNMAEDAGSTSYVAFRPEQIKSATGNSGAFASSNASIMGSGFGSLQSAFEKRGQKKTSAAPAQKQVVPQTNPQQRDLIAGLRRKGEASAKETKGKSMADRIAQAVNRNAEPKQRPKNAPLKSTRNASDELRQLAAEYKANPAKRNTLAGQLLAKYEQETAKTTGEKIKDSAISAAALPRALMASADVSAPLRQGAILTLPPSQWGRAARAGVRMFRGFSTKQYENIREEIADHPDAVEAEYAGLFLATKDREGLNGKEEDFISKWAGKIPIVKHSEQAYKTYLDSLRMDTFAKYKNEIDKRGLSKEENRKAYKAAADWINIATGRGSFGKKIDDAMPALATVFFAPRYTASRFNVLNPMTYAKNLSSAGGRTVLKQQMGDLVQFAGVVGGTLALAKAAGAAVSLDPDDPDFLKIKIGNTRYDALAGLQQPMRLLYRLGKDAARAAQGQQSPRGEGSVEILGKFARSKESPTASFVHDLLSRKDFLGREFDLKRATVERVAPLMWKDMVEAYRREGVGGSAKMLPGMFGVGVQDYAKRPGTFAVSAPSFNKELRRMGVDYSYTQPLEGEPENLHKARSERVRSWLDEYGEGLVNESGYRDLSEPEKKRAIRALKTAITSEANKKEPNTERFNPAAIIERARVATEKKPERDREKIYAEP